MIRLIIKGTMKDAEDAARKRGISLGRITQHDLGANSIHVETLTEANDENWERVRAWYHDYPKTRPPYPVGTLLWCSSRDKELEDEAHDKHVRDTAEAVETEFGK